MTMWGGRFGQEMDPEMWQFNTSIGFDRRLAPQDVRVSQAWARGLQKAGLLSDQEAAAIAAGLDTIRLEVASQSFSFEAHDEDVHSAIERRLTELAGPPAGKLHTGRSRNDQVATDLRLWLMDHLPGLDAAVADLQTVLVRRAEAERTTLMPGYTHLQRAQPITLGHWWLSHFWPLHRDRRRLQQARASAAQLPLGSGALAGTAFSIDRLALSADLGFEAPCPNSLDAVADRDFAAEFLFAAALLGVHVSRLAEGIILYSTREFGFFALADAFATGSSLMPQKKNPDLFELARGQSAAWIGDLMGLLGTLRALPSAYDKDLQGDKQPVFRTFDALAGALPALAGAVRTLSVDPARMAAAIDDDMLTTDLADHLVLQGVPFRQAHEVIGRWVRLALEQHRSLRSFSLAEMRALHPAFTEETFAWFDPVRSVARRAELGGTSPSSVSTQLDQARRAFESMAHDSHSPDRRAGAGGSP